MASLNDFARRMTVRANKIAENTDQLVRKTALAVDREVVTSTPVDQGRAKSNWIGALGSPARRTRDAYVPGESGSTEAQNAQAAMDQAAGVIAGRREGQDIYISNNLPYIGRLNDGYSDQAPSGFVESAIVAGASVARGGKVVD